MILAVDVDYQGNTALIAGVAFNAWADASELGIYTSSVEGVEDYRSGQFFRREMPCIVKLLDRHSLSPECIVVDGYVYLDGEREPGLGKHLYDALNGSVKVVGVAKNVFMSAPEYCKIYRGRSSKPLYITAVGIGHEQAKACVESMHGKFRIPELLKKADRVCRAWESQAGDNIQDIGG